MTRTKNGHHLTSHVSEVAARTLLGAPVGWTLSGLVGAAATTRGWIRVLEMCINVCTREEQHCYKAMLRSIERASYDDASLFRRN